VRELGSYEARDCSIEALQVRDVLLAIALQVREQSQLLRHNTDLKPEEVGLRARGLTAVTHELYERLTYVCSGTPLETPYSTQLTLTYLSRLCIQKSRAQSPAKAGGQVVCAIEDKPISLVVPSWPYSWGFDHLTRSLRNTLGPVLDPDGDLGAGKDRDKMLEILWENLWQERRRERDEPVSQEEVREPLPIPPLPSQLGVLSFPRLEGLDTLLLPIMAHELGHYIDYCGCSPPDYLPHSRAESIKQNVLIRRDQVVKVLARHGNTDWEAVVAMHRVCQGRAETCVRELLADRLAVRMLGLGFFFAHSPALARLAPWPQTRITHSAYPGYAFRVHEVFGAFLEDESPLSTEALMGACRKQGYPGDASWLSAHMNSWAKLLDAANGALAATPSTSKTRTVIDKDLDDSLVVPAINAALPAIKDVADSLIANDDCAQITPAVFDRVRMLKESVPPVTDGDSLREIPEVLASGWLYQLQYGYKEEDQRDAVELARQEKTKTCRLVQQALESLESLSRCASDG